MDPAFVGTFNDLGPIGLLYERLARHEVLNGVPTGRIVGEIAESWTSNAAADVWTVTLRRDRRFEDGTPVNAAAVIFSRDRAINANPALARDSRLIAKLTALDPYTLRYDLAAPSPIFPNFLAYPQASVINPSVMSHVQNGDFARAWLSQNSAGSGPYRLANWEAGQRMLLTASPKASRQPTFFDTVELRPIADESSRLAVFAKGGVDILEGVSLDSRKRLAAAANVEVLNEPSPRWVGLVYNTQSSPLTQANLRKGIDAAIDREALITGVMQGVALPLRTPIPPGVPGYVAGPPVARDLAKAKALLDSVGVSATHRIKLQLNLFKDDSAIESTALALQANLAEVGVDLDLRMLTAAANVQAAQTGQFQLCLYRNAPPIPDPYFVLDDAFRTPDPQGRGSNIAGYANAAVDRLLDRANAESNAAARIELFKQAANLIEADLPISFLYAANGLLGVSKNIRNLNYSAWFPYQYNAAEMTRG